jgi:hypothetical protein
VPNGPKSGKLKTRKGRDSLKTRKGRASLKTRKGRASLKTRKGRASSKTREELVIIKTSKVSLNLKRALWGDKPEGLLPENCPKFLADRENYHKGKFSQGKFFRPIIKITQSRVNFPPEGEKTEVFSGP